MEKRPYQSRDESYSRSDSYSKSDSGYSRDNSSSYSRSDGTSSYSRSDGGSSSYSRSDSSSTYPRSDSSSYSSRGDSSNYSRNGSSGYSRNDSNYSRNDSYSRNDGYRSRGGYSSRGRGAGRYQSGGSGGYGSQNSDSWECPSCKFSNFGSRTSCYKCRQPKDDGCDEPRRKWGKSDDSSWKKPSWNSSDRDRSYSRDSGKGSSNSSWKNNDWGSKGKQCVKTKEDGLIDWDDLKKNEAKYEAERWAHLPEIVKNLYTEDPEVAAMTPEEVKKFREDSNNMSATSSNQDERPIPNPVRTFAQAFASYPMIMQEIQRQGFETPSPIQCQSWPILMKGYDMIGTSQTGTGKTLAFLLPALLHIVAQPTPRWERIGPTVLVLAPTRELAQQIEREVLKFEYENIRCVCVYGQGDRRSQIQKLNAMSEIVIATPGRLNDLCEQGVANLNGVSYLVLDEADRMLDMGFEPQVRKIVLNIRPNRQTILTSATWPNEVRTLASKLMKDPIHVVIGSLDLQAVDTITQHVIVCSIMEKEEKLMGFLKEMKPEDKAIVFVGQKITVDDLSVKLYEAGFYVESMHGGRNQRDREYSLRQLKTGRSKILIATDVAARGIDINDITHVLNYDCPKDMEEYVHRVGRTGRAGRRGQSLTLMCRDDWKVAGKLIEILEKSAQNVPPELWQMKKRWDRAQSERQDRYSRNGHYGGGGGGGGGGRSGWFSP